MSPIISVGGPAPAFAVPLAVCIGLVYFAYRVVATLPLAPPGWFALAGWWLGAELAGWCAVLAGVGAPAWWGLVARGLAPLRAGLYVVPVLALFAGELPVQHEPYASLALVAAWGSMWLSHYLATGRSDGAQALAQDVQAGYAWLRARVPALAVLPWVHLLLLELGVGWLLGRLVRDDEPGRWFGLALLPLLLPCSVGLARGLEMRAWGAGWHWRLPTIAAGIAGFVYFHLDDRFVRDVATGKIVWNDAHGRLQTLLERQRQAPSDANQGVRLLKALNRMPLADEIRSQTQYRALRDYVPRAASLALAVAAPTGRSPQQAVDDLVPLLTTAAPAADEIDYLLATMRVAPLVGAYELAARTATQLLRVKAETSDDLRYLWVQEPGMRIEAARLYILAGRHRAAADLLQTLPADAVNQMLRAKSAALQGDLAPAEEFANRNENRRGPFAEYRILWNGRQQLLARVEPFAASRADVASVVADTYTAQGQPLRALAVLDPWLQQPADRANIWCSAFGALAACESPPPEYFTLLSDRWRALQAVLPNERALWFPAARACQKLGLLNELEYALKRAAAAPVQLGYEFADWLRLLLDLGRDFDVRQALPKPVPADLIPCAVLIEINARSATAAAALLETPAPNVPYELRAEVALVQRDFAGVESALDQRDLGVRKVEALLATGRHADAAELLTTRLTKDFDQPQLWDALLDAVSGCPTVPAKTTALLVRIADAWPAAQRSARQNTRLALALWRCGGQREAALTAARAAFAQAPTHPEQRRELAIALLVNDEPMAALVQLRGLVPRPNDHWLMLAVRAQLHDDLTVETECRWLLERHPQQPYLLWYLADAATRLNRVASAAETYQELLRLWPNHESVQKRLALLALNRRDYDVALAELLKLLEADPERLDLLPALVEAAAGVSPQSFPVGARQDQLRELLKQSATTTLAEAHPKLPQLANLIQAFRRLDDATQYLALLRHAVQVAPQERSFQMQLADALTANGQRDEADAIYRSLAPVPK
jgi:tetratricopeptide (TPR) repeat protein